MIYVTWTWNIHIFMQHSIQTIMFYNVVACLGLSLMKNKCVTQFKFMKHIWNNICNLLINSGFINTIVIHKISPS